MRRQWSCKQSHTTKTRDGLRCRTERKRPEEACYTTKQALSGDTNLRKCGCSVGVHFYFARYDREYGNLECTTDSIPGKCWTRYMMINKSQRLTTNPRISPCCTTVLHSGAMSNSKSLQKTPSVHLYRRVVIYSYSQELTIPATTRPVFKDRLAALNSDASFGENSENLS